MKCLYCGAETTGPFCLGGGRFRHKTGMTKSYCLSSFLEQLKSADRMGFERTGQQAFFLTRTEEIKEWYKSIPLVGQGINDHRKWYIGEGNNVRQVIPGVV